MHAANNAVSPNTNTITNNTISFAIKTSCSRIKKYFGNSIIPDKAGLQYKRHCSFLLGSCRQFNEAKHQKLPQRFCPSSWKFLSVSKLWRYQSLPRFSSPHFQHFLSHRTNYDTCLQIAQRMLQVWE